MTTLRTAPRRGAKAAASIAALILLPLSLTACGGDDSSSSLDGTYADESSLLVVDGNTMTFQSFDGCDVLDRIDAQGTLNDDQTQVLWDTSVEQGLDGDTPYVGKEKIDDATSTVSVTTVDDNTVITVNGSAYQAADRDEAINAYAGGSCN
ncbi:hypothetical protein VR010_14180 [Actinomycetaceae bacterium L2_0104]